MSCFNVLVFIYRLKFSTPTP